MVLSLLLSATAGYLWHPELLSSEELKKGRDILFHLDCGKMKKAVIGPGGVKSLKFDTGYFVYPSEFFGFGRNLEGASLTVEVEAASPDGCLLGVMLRLYADGEKIGGVTAIWRKELGTNFQTFTSDVTLPKKKIDSVRVYIFRTQKKGTLFLKSVTVKKKITAQTEN